jgi:hypothetical protein
VSRKEGGEQQRSKQDFSHLFLLMLLELMVVTKVIVPTWFDWQTTKQNFTRIPAIDRADLNASRRWNVAGEQQFVFIAAAQGVSLIRACDRRDYLQFSADFRSQTQSMQIQRKAIRNVDAGRCA